MHMQMCQDEEILDGLSLFLNQKKDMIPFRVTGFEHGHAYGFIRMAIVRHVQRKPFSNISRMNSLPPHPELGNPENKSAQSPLMSAATYGQVVIIHLRKTSALCEWNFVAQPSCDRPNHRFARLIAHVATPV